MFGSAQAQTQADDSAVLSTVVVTAQKRSQSAQEVPISMTVLGEGALEKAHIRSLYDIQQAAPNFEAIQSPGWSTVNVRGIGGGGRSIGWDTRVGVYLDGVYMGQVQALDQSLGDIDQIEILRGPQGHLFGRNTDAGAVSITTKAPSKTFEGSVSGGLSNYSGHELSASLSGPLSTTVQGKISVTSEQRDGIITNLANGNKLNDLDRLGARGQISAQLSKDLTVDLYADYTKSNEKLVVGEPTTWQWGVPLAGGPLAHRNVSFSFDPYRNSELSGASMSINYQLGGGNKFTSITAFRDTKQDRSNDTDYSAADLFRIEYTDHFKQTSQEFRFTSPNSGKLRYVGGLYLLREVADTNRKAIIGQQISSMVPLGPLSPANPAALGPFSTWGVKAGGQVTNDGSITTTNYALFGNVDYDILTNLTLNLGVRYTHENKDVLYNLDGAGSGFLGIATLKGYTDSRTDNKTTPTVGLNFAASKETNFYTKYSTGFKSGGWNTDFLNARQVADGLRFNTESVKSVEFGVKGQLAGGRVQYDAAVFKSKFDDYQVFQFVVVSGRSVLQLKNAAKVDSQGFEGSARWRVARDFTVGANIAYLDAKYSSYPNGGGPGVDYSGQRLADTPRITASLNASYGIPVPSMGGRLELSGDLNYRGDTVLGGIFKDLPSRSLVNARLAYTPNAGNWTTSVWVRNLGNDDYVIARGADFLGNQFDTRGLPRVFGITGKYDF